VIPFFLARAIKSFIVCTTYISNFLKRTTLQQTFLKKCLTCKKRKIVRNTFNKTVKMFASRTARAHENSSTANSARSLGSRRKTTTTAFIGRAMMFTTKSSLVEDDFLSLPTSPNKKVNALSIVMKRKGVKTRRAMRNKSIENAISEPELTQRVTGSTNVTNKRSTKEVKWSLNRAPFEEGGLSEIASGQANSGIKQWGPTNQTIKDWRSVYRNSSLSNKTQTKLDEREIPERCVVDGAIPKDLRGTLFRNGPGMLDIYGKELNQFFDGDGLVHTYEFDGSEKKIKFKHNYVETKGFYDERAEQKMLYKGAFAVGNPKGDSFYNPFDFNVKNVANTGIVEWNDKVYALWEGGKPHELREDDLITIGREVDEVLGQELRVPQMAAHYRVLEEEKTNERTLIAFSIESQPSAFPFTTNKAAFYEWNEDLSEKKRVDFDVPNATFGFFHDMLVTENWYCLFQNPTSLDFQKLMTEYMFAKCALAETIAMQKGKRPILWMFPRSEKAKKIGTKSYELENQFFFHHINAFERENGEVCLDSVPWKFMDFSMNLDMVTPAFWQDGSRTEYTRFTVNPYLETDTNSIKQKSLSERCCEFPCLNPKFAGKEHKYVYCGGSVVKDARKWGPNQCLVKYDVSKCGPGGEEKALDDVYYYGERSFVQEPIFASKPNGMDEDDGYLLQLVNDAGEDKTFLYIFDAKKIGQGYECKIELMDEHVPPGLHGFWSPQKI